MNAYRKVSVFAVCLGILVLQAGCQQKAKVAVEPEVVKPAAEKAGPRIEFESLVYDFGKVGPGQKLIGAFKFTNTGDVPLKIKGVDKCCGAVTKLDKQELAPGESGSLQVQYTSGRIAGAMSKRLYVNSNDKAKPKAELTIKAETVLKVTYEPRNIKLILKDENAVCPKITIKSTDNQPFSITSFASTGNCLTAQFDKSVRATEFVLEPKADMEKLQKSRSGRITIGLAFSQAGETPETISIIFQALSRFTIRPTMLVIFYDKPGEVVQKSLLIANNYGEDFEIESTSSKEGHIKVHSQNKITNGYQFALEITPPSEDVKRFNDTFSITLKDGEKLDVPCRGLYRTTIPTKTTETKPTN
jgi:hypothetical protein